MRGRKRHLRSVGEMTVMPLKRPPDGRPSDCSCRTKGATRLLAAMRARRQSRGGPGGGNGLANREIWRARVARDDVRRALGCATPLRPRSDALSGRLETFAGGIPSESSPFVCAYPFEVDVSISSLPLETKEQGLCGHEPGRRTVCTRQLGDPQSRRSGPRSGSVAS